MAISKANQTTRRLNTLSNKGIKNRARVELEHNLNLFEEHTGKKVTTENKNGQLSIKTPKNLSQDERETFNAILDSFLNDPTSTLSGIKQEFKNVPSGLKQSGTKYTEQQKAELIDKSQRIVKEHAIEKMYASDVLQKVWEVVDANDWNTTDVLNAMMGLGTLYAVGEEKEDFNTEYSRLGFLLGEDEKEIPFDLLSQKQARDDEGKLSGGAIQDQIIDYLLEVLEARK